MEEADENIRPKRCASEATQRKSTTSALKWLKQNANSKQTEHKLHTEWSAVVGELGKKEMA